MFFEFFLQCLLRHRARRGQGGRAPQKVSSISCRFVLRDAVSQTKYCCSFDTQIFAATTFGKIVGVVFGAGRVRDKKFFVRATGCWLNACENDVSKKFNATESLWYKGIATFSRGGETTDWSFQLSVIVQEMRFAWRRLALLLNKCCVWLGISWKTHLRSLSVDDILFFNSDF